MFVRLACSIHNYGAIRIHMSVAFAFRHVLAHLPIFRQHCVSQAELVLVFVFHLSLSRSL
jgi:hypothetical protein